MKHLLLAIGLVIAALHARSQPGYLDDAFNPTDIGFANGDGPNGAVRTIALQSNGSVVVGGDFTAYNGSSINRIALLNSDGSLDSRFNANTTKANNSVYSLALQGDGKVLVGGAFTDFNSNWYHDYMTRLDPDGTLDAYFNTNSGVNGTPGGANGPVYSIAVQSDGRILIAGLFNYFNGTSRHFIARLDREGYLDPSFDPGQGVPGGVTTMALQPDGRILVAGSFTDPNGVSRPYIMRLHGDGSPDASFAPGSGVNNTVSSLAVLGDGKILIGGAFTSYDGTTRNRIARLNSNGSLDASFNPAAGANGAVQSLAVLSDGRILIGGDFTTYKGAVRNRIARLTSNGNLDATFDPGSGANQGVYSIALTGNSQVLIGGAFTSYDGTTRNRIARLNQDGSLDVSFNRGSGARGPVASISLQADSKILIGGDFTTYNGVSRNYIARLGNDGFPDMSFNPGSGADTAVLSTAIQADGKILVAGAFTTFNGAARNRIARLHPDGSLDASFNPGSGANSFIWSVVPQPDGKILIGGYFTAYNGTIRNRIARLHPDGSLDASFNPGAGPSGTVTTMVLQADGKVLIGGNFTAYSGNTRNYIARLNPDGSLDATFNTGSGTNNPIAAMALQADGKILIGGAFTTYNGTARNRIARLHPDGSLDASFNAGSLTTGTVSSMAVQSDGRILVGGNGTFTNNTTYWNNAMARLDGNGSLDLSFNSNAGGANNTVCAMVVQPDGKILIGGHFTAYNGKGRNRIARIHGGANTLTVGTIAPLSFCAGTELSIPFTATGVYAADNDFVAQLSDAWGNFGPTAGMREIGRLGATASGSIPGLLPHDLPSGTGYRIRVVSSRPMVVSPDNGYNLTINTTPATPTVSVPGDSAFCDGSSITLTASAFWGIQWYKDSVAVSGATARYYAVSQPGLYSVMITQNNCSSSMSPVVKVSSKPVPPRPVISQEGNLLTSSASSGVQWYKDGVAISGATGAQHVARSSGLYTVQVTENGCSAQSDAVNVVLTAVADPATGDDGVTVYPIPVQDELHFTNTGARKLRVQLLDIMGQKLREVQFAAASASLSLKELAPGPYLLLITDLKKGETISKTIVKQ